MKMKLLRGYFRAKGLLEDFAKEERGAADIIAIILIIVVVIGLAAFFRDGIKEVVTNLMERIKGEAGGFQSWFLLHFAELSVHRKDAVYG